MLTRRQFLQAGLSTATLATLPLSIQRALAIPADSQTGSIRDVAHVVILMQENRAFDHYFGTLRGVRGFGDRFTIPQPDGLNVWQQRDAFNNVVLPHYLDQTRGKAQRVGMTNHTWVDARDAWDHGRMSHWPQHKNIPFLNSHHESMSYFKRQEIGYHFALAEAFTVCDNYYSALRGGTNTNRLYFFTGSNGASVGHKVVVNNHWDSLAAPSSGFKWTTYPERLQKAGVSWKVYQNLPDNFTDNPLAGFVQYRQQYQDANIGNAAYNSALDADFPLLKGVANTMPDGGLLQSFKDDINNNQLPQVSWIVAPGAYCEHPDPSSPVQGAFYIKEILEALCANPEVWSKTVFFINYDENDGYFDHMPPPSPPSIHNGKTYGDSNLGAKALADEYYTQETEAGMPSPDGAPFGAGMRVPMLIVSPWSKGGYVNSQAFDHTSVLRFLEARFGVAEPNISQFRRQVFGDLTSALQFNRPNQAFDAQMLAGRVDKKSADALRAAQDIKLPAALNPNRQIPRQEFGTALSHALPYELHASARVDKTAKRVKILLANSGAQGAVIHLYDQNQLDKPPYRYVIAAGKALAAELDCTDGRYDLWLLSVNGWHRAFVGDCASDQDCELQVCYAPCAQKIHARIHNHSAQEHIFTISDNGYFAQKSQPLTVAAHSVGELVFALEDSMNWYDFSVRHAGDLNWQRRFAGRMETGKTSISDPLLSRL